MEHIVILMLEHRAFDPYFGTLRGVRGFGDPRPMTTPSGQPVWFQPDGAGTTLPFHPTAPDFGLQFLVDTAHGWFDQHAAWTNGRYDQWIAAKETNGPDPDDSTVVLTITNLGKAPIRVTVDNAYGNDDSITRLLRPGQSDRQRWRLEKSFGCMTSRS